MKILYLNPIGRIGGAERVLLSVLAAVRQACPEASLYLIAGAEGPLLGHAERLGVHTTVMPIPSALAGLGDFHLRGSGQRHKLFAVVRQLLAAGPAAWLYAHRLHELIRCISPDLIHSIGIKTHLLSQMAGTGRIPVVWHAHDFYSQRPVASHLLRWRRKRVAAVVAISEAVATDLRNVLPGTLVQVIYNAINVHEFTPAAVDGNRLDELAGLPPAKPQAVRVGLVATYARWKGQDVFLRAIARVVAGPLAQPIRSYLIGAPIYQTPGSQFSEQELRALAQHLHIERHVGFIGFQEHLAPIYQALDIVVHASTQPEPFGLTIVEAMACARAVIVSRAGGAMELFTHNHDAVGVPPGDVAALATAMSDLIQDPQRRRRLAENAMRTAQQRFHLDRLGPCMLKLYQQVCELATGPEGS